MIFARVAAAFSLIFLAVSTSASPLWPRSAVFERNNNRDSDKNRYGNVYLSDVESFVVKAYTRAFVEHDVKAIDAFWSPEYVEHDATLSNGFAAIKAFASKQSRVQYETGFLASWGPVVALRTRQTPPGGNATIVVEFFLVRGGRIAEHWATRQQEVPAAQTVSKRAMFDPSERWTYNLSACPTTDKQYRNSLLSSWFLDQAFNKYSTSNIRKIMAADVKQRNPTGADGLDFFVNIVQQLAGSPLRPPRRFEPGFQLAKCDISITHGRWTIPEFGGMLAIADTYRFWQDGTIVEHWDVIDALVPDNKTVSGNAMFSEGEFELQYVP